MESKTTYHFNIESTLMAGASAYYTWVKRGQLSYFVPVAVSLGCAIQAYRWYKSNPALTAMQNLSFIAASMMIPHGSLPWILIGAAMSNQQDPLVKKVTTINHEQS